MFFEKNFYSSSGCGPNSHNSRQSLSTTKLDIPQLKHWERCGEVLSRNCALIFTLASCVLLCALSGCGSNYTVTAAGIGSFQASSAAVEFGNVEVGQTANTSLTLVNQGLTDVSVTNLKITGKEFKVASPSSLPVTVAANSSYKINVEFKPSASGNSTGQLTVSSSSQKSPSLKVKLHGNGAAAASPSTPKLSSLSCSQSFVTGPSSDTCTANLTAAAGSSGLMVTLSSNDDAVTVPASVTVPSGATSAGFTATITAVTTAQAATLTASAGGANQTFVISLGTAGQSEPGVELSQLICSQNSITGSGSDACTVTLNGAATGNGLVVNLASNQNAVSVPGTVTVPSGATSAGFTATIASVTTAQTATLTASAGGGTQTFGISLGAASSAPNTPGLEMSTSSLNFGSVAVNTKSTPQSVTLTSSGTAPLIINSATPSGTGFSVSGTSFPVTLNPGQTASLTVIFDPTVSGTANETISISDNATPSTAAISLSGIGQSAPGVVALSQLSCSRNSITGSGSDTCTVTLNGAATGNGLVVNLASNQSAVSVPGTVTVPTGATSAVFTATAAAVTTAETATLTASAGGATQTFGISLGAFMPGLKMSTASLNFGDVAKDTKSSPQSIVLTSSGTAPLTINSAVPSGAGFTVSGTTFPTTLNPGQTASLTVVFNPTVMGTATGTISISDNASPSTAAISLSGTGMAGTGTLSGLSCATNSFSGSGSDACTVTLTAAAGSGGLAVSLSSTNNAVTVPGSVIVPAGSSSIGFTAAVSAVTTAQTAAVTASAGGVTKSYAINLGTAAPALSLSTSSVPFGNVNLNSPATQQVTLTSSGTAPLIISAGSATGAGFTISGISYPLTLNPGQAATLSIQFDPTSAGAATGTVTLTSNASPSKATITLSGTGGTSSYEVELTWSAPTSSTDPVAGYNVYRAAGSGSSYQLLNSSVNPDTAYTDSTVQNGTSYTYYVESVDANGNQSTPSNTFSASIP